MSQWVLKGLNTGTKTTSYPVKPETAAGISPGLPVSGNDIDDKVFDALMRCCPVQVFRRENQHQIIKASRCIHCMRCRHAVATPATWDFGYEWGVTTGSKNEYHPAFGGSVHICVVDAGDCGACLHEVRQLNNPYYNMHRLGLFITPSPRHADLLLIVGAVTDHMKFALEKTYEAMPTPKKVVAVGACAITGGIFADSIACVGKVSDILPVDVEVPGNPPPPLAILHGLLLATGRKTTLRDD